MNLFCSEKITANYRIAPNICNFLIFRLTQLIFLVISYNYTALELFNTYTIGFKHMHYWFKQPIVLALSTYIIGFKHL